MQSNQDCRTLAEYQQAHKIFCVPVDLIYVLCNSNYVACNSIYVLFGFCFVCCVCDLCAKIGNIFCSMDFL